MHYKTPGYFDRLTKIVKAIVSKFKISIFFTIVFIPNLTTVDLGCQLLLIGLFRVRFNLGADFPLQSLCHIHLFGMANAFSP